MANHRQANAIEEQIISCVDHMFLRSLRHRITGFTHVTAKQMIEHLHTVWGRFKLNRHPRQ
jgi:hypothetical protein